MARPFLKWAGGKTQLLPILLQVLPRVAETYYEPFLGGGAVYYALADRDRFHQATLNDFNVDLVDTYKAVRDMPEEVINLLRDMPFERDFYEAARLHKPEGLAERAARIIYLNKTCFNGLYRVNQRGEFNAPFGDFQRPPRILDAPNLRDCSNVLRYQAAIYSGDFVDAVAGAREGDVVYFDPPYVPLNSTASFTSYTRDGFTLDDQRRVAICFRDLSRKGVMAIMSNSDVPIIRELYKEFDIHAVPVRRPINSVGSARGFVQEVLAFNFDDPDRGEKLAKVAEEIAARREKQSQKRYATPLEGQDAFNLAMELGLDDEPPEGV
jgi:DNA adenine methylase